MHVCTVLSIDMRLSREEGDASLWGSGGVSVCWGGRGVCWCGKGVLVREGRLMWKVRIGIGRVCFGVGRASDVEKV